jgi:flavin-binding protein dodecin
MIEDAETPPRNRRGSADIQGGNAFARAAVYPGEAKREVVMAVYKVIEIVGTSPDSWEKAAAAAIERASQSLRDLRIAEVVKQDVQIDNGKIAAYRTRLNVSFRFEDD